MSHGFAGLGLGVACFPGSMAGEERKRRRGRGRRVQRADGPTYRILLTDQHLGPPWMLSGQDKGWGNKGQEELMGIKDIKELTCKFRSQTEEI